MSLTAQSQAFWYVNVLETFKNIFQKCIYCLSEPNNSKKLIILSFLLALPYQVCQPSLFAEATNKFSYFCPIVDKMVRRLHKVVEYKKFFFRFSKFIAARRVWEGIKKRSKTIFQRTYQQNLMGFNIGSIQVNWLSPKVIAFGAVGAKPRGYSYSLYEDEPNSYNSAKLIKFILTSPFCTTKSTVLHSLLKTVRLSSRILNASTMLKRCCLKSSKNDLHIFSSSKSDLSILFLMKVNLSS